MQGVGFRPHVYRLATGLGLGGWVLNAPDGVTIEIEGPPAAVDTFVRELRRRPPRLARIATLEVVDVPVTGPPSPAGKASFGCLDRRFAILASLDEGVKETLVSPDVATCEACRRELSDPTDRRHGYPFTNCTDCGPRYTIIRGLPYDRPLTSMTVFPMCPECQAEYDDPVDRRFHAQPNACPVCGPRVWLETSDGRALDGGDGPAGSGGGPLRTSAAASEPPSWAAAFRQLIRGGAIVAVKGLGGFHLACDARSEEAVARLRQRKRRPAKPFAVMARDLEAARRYVMAGPAAESYLSSPAAPIVILPLRPARPGAPAAAPSVSPGSPTLGLMLAYTPLHVLLFDEDLDLLVMTSANRSDLPIVKDNDAARAELAGIADYFLLHDREIVNRCEDSVVRVVEPGPESEAAGVSPASPASPAAEQPADGAPALVIPYRRSRGYAPAPIDVGSSLPGADREAASWAGIATAAGIAAPAGIAPAAGVILGAGAEMKSTFCLLRGSQAFLSPHLGEMEFVESLQAYREAFDRYVEILGCRPALVAFDPHPGYRVSRLARDLADAGRPVFHHHAHLVSCLADNGLPGDEEVLGVVCDGTGYGPDGAVWGFELLAATAASFRRLGHLACVPLPGGDVVARRPFRAAAAHLYRALGPEGVRRLARLYPEQATELEVSRRLLEARPRRAQGGDGPPLSSSCGRLFDAVAAMAGVTAENTYEGQAAVELSGLLDAPDRNLDAAGPLLADPPERFRFAITGGGNPGGAPAAGAPAVAGQAPVEEGPLVLDPAPFLVALLEDLEAGRQAPRADAPGTNRPADAGGIALLFHQALVRGVTEALVILRRRTGLARVCLSGGTFQSPHLVRALRQRLEADGFTVFTHRQVPPNDGGLALGQAVAAAWLGSKEMT